MLRASSQVAISSNALGNSIVGAIETTPGEQGFQFDNSQVPGNALNSYDQIQQNGVFGPTSQLGDNITLPIGDAAPADVSTPDSGVAETDEVAPVPAAVAGTNTGGGTTAAVAQNATATALALNALNGAGTGQSVFTGRSTQVADSGQVFSDASYTGGGSVSSDPSADGFVQLDGSGNPAPVNVVEQRQGFFSNLIGDLGAGDFGAAATLTGNEIGALAQQAESGAASFLSGTAASNLMYVPGPIPVSQLNLGGASFFVNSALNTIDSAVNVLANAGQAGLRAASPVLNFLGDNQGEIMSAEANFLPGQLASETMLGTAALGSAARGIRSLIPELPVQLPSVSATADATNTLTGSAANGIYLSKTPLAETFPELVGVNPSYVEGAGQGVNINCVACANAAQQRLLGVDLNATAEASTAYGTPNDLLPSAPFGFGAPTTPSAVEQSMLSAGDGSVGVLRIQQDSGIEHVINVTNRNGGVVFLDTQSGHIVTLNPDLSVLLGTP